MYSFFLYFFMLIILEKIFTKQIYQAGPKRDPFPVKFQTGRQQTGKCQISIGQGVPFC